MTILAKASVMFLPIIDMNSSNTTCIYLTLAFVTEHARRRDVSPIITFDQPIWWKALMIIRSEALVSDLRRIILRLGGFHAEMSFLGCIGHVLTSYGVQELPGFDMCTQRSDAYAECEGHCSSRPLTCHSRRRSQCNDAY